MAWSSPAQFFGHGRTCPCSTTPAKFAGARPTGGGGLQAYVPVPARPPRRATGRQSAARVGRGAGSFRVSRHEGYGFILRKVRHRRYLRDGADRSIQLEQLGLAQVPSRDAADERTKSRYSGRCSQPSAWRWRGRYPVLHREGEQRRLDSPGRSGDRTVPSRNRASTWSWACSRDSTTKISSSRWRSSKARCTPTSPARSTTSQPDTDPERTFRPDHLRRSIRPRRSRWRR